MDLEFDGDRLLDSLLLVELLLRCSPGEADLPGEGETLLPLIDVRDICIVLRLLGEEARRRGGVCGRTGECVRAGSENLSDR
jgi:hypothetical protein